MLQFLSRLRTKEKKSTGSDDAAEVRMLLLADKMGATQAISFLRPLATVCAQGRCRIVAMDETTIETRGPNDLRDAWRELRPTVFVMSRYAGGAETALVKAARRDGVPIIYHIDDNLFEVPSSLGGSKGARYNDPRRLAALSRAISHSDILYTSTSELAHQLSARFPGKRVIAGHIYCAHEPKVVAHLRQSPITIGYMGTSGHAHDLAIVVPHLAALLEGHPNIRFETFGTIKMPADLERFGARISHHPPLGDYDAFLDRLASLGWHIGIAPLLDSRFNRCKADTKWVEYTAAGIPVVASDLPVYHRACSGGGGVLVSDDGWGSALNRLVLNAAERHFLVSTAQERLRSLYSPQALQHQVWRVLTEGRL